MPFLAVSTTVRVLYTTDCTGGSISDNSPYFVFVSFGVLKNLTVMFTLIPCLRAVLYFSILRPLLSLLPFSWFLRLFFYVRIYVPLALHFILIPLFTFCLPLPLFLVCSSFLYLNIPLFLSGFCFIFFLRRKENSPHRKCSGNDSLKRLHPINARKQ